MKRKLIILISLILIIILVVILPRPKTVPILPSPAPSVENKFNLQQTPDDFKYSQTLTELHQQYPWYSKLPLETKEYRIIYDFDKKSFRIRLLQSITPEVKQKALDALKNIGVDLTAYTYYFL